jgi:Fic family protein
VNSVINLYNCVTVIFNEMGYMEETALGMDTFKSIIGNKALGKLSNEELVGYEWIKSQGEISAKDYSANFKITPRTTSRHLGKLLKLKLIKPNDENPKSPKLRYKAT